MRWIVLASWPVSSDMRFAARPVGAARNTFSPFSIRMRMIALSVVVLPVPGPPVRIRRPFSSAARIASFCSCAYRMPSLRSISSISRSTPTIGSGGYRSIMRMRSALYTSQRCCFGRKIKSRPLKFSQTASKSLQSAYSAACASSSGTPSICAAAAQSLSAGRQVWPLSRLWRSTYKTPALTRSAFARSYSSDSASLSATAKSTAICSLHSRYGSS